MILKIKNKKIHFELNNIVNIVNKITKKYTKITRDKTRTFFRFCAGKTCVNSNGKMIGIL